MSAAEKQSKITRLLIVDDEPDFRQALEFSFKRLGYQVFSAANGRDAFNLIQSNPIDVVISDIRMPGGDGVELLDRTKALRPDMPVVLLVTGFADLTTEEAHNKGAEALFSKPFNTKVIQEAIGRLLTSPEQRWSRLSDRVEAELKIQLQFQDMPKAIDAQVLNLGRGGMFVSLSQGQYPNVNDPVGFGITFDGDPASLDGSGVVRWVRTQDVPSFPAGCGIEFTHLDEPGRKRIIDFVAAKKPKAFIPNR